MKDKPLAASTHLCSTVSQLFEPQVQKIAVFTYRSPHFCFPLEMPLRLSRNKFHGWKDNSMLPKHLAACIYLSFRVIRCLSQCVSPKIVIFNTFLFPLGRPWGNHAKCYMDGKRIRCLQIASLNVPI